MKDIARFESELMTHVKISYPQLRDAIMSGKKLSDDQLNRLRSEILEFKKTFVV